MEPPPKRKANFCRNSLQGRVGFSDSIPLFKMGKCIIPCQMRGLSRLPKKPKFPPLVREFPRLWSFGTWGFGCRTCWGFGVVRLKGLSGNKTPPTPESKRSKNKIKPGKSSGFFKKDLFFHGFLMFEKILWHQIMSINRHARHTNPSCSKND